MGQGTEELKQRIEDTRSDMSGTLEAIGDRVSPSAVATRSKNRVIVGAQSVRDRVMGVAEAAQHSVSDTAAHAGEAVTSAPDALASRTQGAPMVAGALAFGVGFLIAAAFPATEKEKQVSAKVMESLEPMKDQLTDTAHEVAEHLKQPATDAANTVKDAATTAAHEVADTAKGAADDTRQQATEAVETVRSGGTFERPTSPPA